MHVLVAQDFVAAMLLHGFACGSWKNTAGVTVYQYPPEDGLVEQLVHFLHKRTIKSQAALSRWEAAAYFAMVNNHLALAPMLPWFRDERLYRLKVRATLETHVRHFYQASLTSNELYEAVLVELDRTMTRMAKAESASGGASSDDTAVTQRKVDFARLLGNAIAMVDVQISCILLLRYAFQLYHNATRQHRAVEVIEGTIWTSMQNPRSIDYAGLPNIQRVEERPKTVYLSMLSAFKSVSRETQEVAFNQHLISESEPDAGWTSEDGLRLYLDLLAAVKKPEQKAELHSLLQINDSYRSVIVNGERTVEKLLLIKQTLVRRALSTSSDEFDRLRAYLQKVIRLSRPAGGALDPAMLKAQSLHFHSSATTPTATPIVAIFQEATYVDEDPKTSAPYSNSERPKALMNKLLNACLPFNAARIVAPGITTTAADFSVVRPPLPDRIFGIDMTQYRDEVAQATSSTSISAASDISTSDEF